LFCRRYGKSNIRNDKEEKEMSKEFEEAMEIYHCDWRKKCKRKPYVEVFPLRIKPIEKRKLPCDIYEFNGWSYLCRRHFYWEWMKHNILYKLIGNKKRLGYGEVETPEEIKKRIEEDLKYD
jgi:hypothetical protein